MGKKREYDEYGLLERDYWKSPPEIEYFVNTVYGHSHPQLDPCAGDTDLARVNWDIRKGQDAMAIPWNFDTVYINPPYSRGWIDRFITRALEFYGTRQGPHGIIWCLPMASSPDWAGRMHVHSVAAIDVDHRIQFRPPEGVEESTNRGDTRIYLWTTVEEYKRNFMSQGNSIGRPYKLR